MSENEDITLPRCDYLLLFQYPSSYINPIFKSRPKVVDIVGKEFPVMLQII